MSLPLPPFPVAPPVAPRKVRRSPAVGRLLAGALALAALAVLVDRADGPVLLVLVVVALAAAGFLAARARWAAYRPGTSARPARRQQRGPAPWTEGATVTEQLSLLHDAHVEKVNTAIAEGREDLVEELSAAYADEALRLLTR